MRTLTVMEMDAVSGGEKTRLQNLGQCAVDTVIAGASGAALGLALGGVLIKPLAAAGMIGAIVGADSCIAALT